MDNAKKAIIEILCLYLGASGVFLCLFFGFLYAKESRHLLAQQISKLREMSLEVYDILYTNKDDLSLALAQIESNITYPIAIYHHKGQVIYNSLESPLSENERADGIAIRGDKVIIEPSMHEYSPKPLHRQKKRDETKKQGKDSNKVGLEDTKDKNTKLHKLYKSPRYQVFIQDDSLDSDMLFLRLRLIAYFLLSFFAMGVIAYFLVRLSLKPMREKIDLLNSFIKDSTHEINTPLSIILMSIETLQRDNLTQSQIQKIERIKLASKSLSHLYKDLVAYNFPHTISDKNENLALHLLLQERLEYFTPFFEQKSIVVQSRLEERFINASAEKITCVVDNLLHNAIKYNKKGGKIHIVLREGFLSISDSGCGINEKECKKIFERYVRCNDFQGGFGIGLTLIKRICDEYHIDIEVQSEVGEGSCFTLLWDNTKNLK
ncbi:sensor histidine kinase [Helicobacter typhlonius]|uniref:sensor histidine kinase n=1 Tax=Helicobacter typhlonius TaxID=76936 RepID=UPI002FDF2DB8